MLDTTVVSDIICLSEFYKLALLFDRVVLAPFCPMWNVGEGNHDPDHPFFKFVEHFKIPNSEQQNEMETFWHYAVGGQNIEPPSWIDEDLKDNLRILPKKYLLSQLLTPGKLDWKIQTNDIQVIWASFWSTYLQRYSNARPCLMLPDDVGLSTPAFALILKDIELPSDETPPEAIIEFRKDAKARELLLALRIWARKAANSLDKLPDFQEEFEYHKLCYNNYIEQEKIRFKKKKLAMAFTKSIIFASQLLTLNPKSFETFIELKNLRKSIVQVRPYVPGYEIAYLYEVNSRFRD